MVAQRTAVAGAQPARGVGGSSTGSSSEMGTGRGSSWWTGHTPCLSTRRRRTWRQAAASAVAPAAVPGVRAEVTAARAPLLGTAAAAVRCAGGPPPASSYCIMLTLPSLPEARTTSACKRSEESCQMLGCMHGSWLWRARCACVTHTTCCGPRHHRSTKVAAVSNAAALPRGATRSSLGRGTRAAPPTVAAPRPAFSSRRPARADWFPPQPSCDRCTRRGAKSN